MEYEFRKFRGRLAQFRRWDNHPDHWEERWSKVSISDLMNTYLSGYLDEFELFTRYLTKDMPVLEAGCGLGQLVVALSARGYSVEGVDYSGKTVDRAKAIVPDLNIHVGNVYALDVPDGSYGGYISLGVFEHNPEGPMAGLLEARRVIAPQGVALISVPYLNPARKKILHRVPLENDVQLFNGLSFYQYYFSISDFVLVLRESGFKVIYTYPYAVYAAVTRDLTIGRWLHSKGFFKEKIRHNFVRSCEKAPMWMRFHWGHMVLFVCKSL
jgi:SAM-dependent methyltransferase